MIYAYLKDGITVYAFDDASVLRALLHDRPGHKSKNGIMAVRTLVRSRDSVALTDIGVENVRYVSRQSISHVVEGDEVRAVPAEREE